MVGRSTGAWRHAFLVVAFAAAVRPPPTFAAVWSVAADTTNPSPSPSPTGSPGSGGGTSALVVNGAEAQTLLSLPVQTSKGEDLGRVVDVVVDRKGALLAAIVDFGGFLGVGSRKIAVDWRILHFPESGGISKLVVDLPLDKLRDAPVFKPGEPIVIMGAPAAPSSTPAPSPPSSPETKP